jgi:hypothetical protein
MPRKITTLSQTGKFFFAGVGQFRIGANNPTAPLTKLGIVCSLEAAFEVAGLLP